MAGRRGQTLPVRPKGSNTVKGASDGRGGEHEFGGDADVHAGYDGGCGAWVALIERHGHGSIDGITSSGVLSLAGNQVGRDGAVSDRWRDGVDKAAGAAEGSNTVKGASDGRGREHEFGGDADVHAGYGGDAWWRSRRHGHERR